MTRNMIACALAGLIVLGSGGGASAIDVTATLDPDQLKNALLGGAGEGIDLSSVVITVSGHSDEFGGASAGTYTNAAGTYGIGSGAIISTGYAADYGTGPNDSDANSGAFFVEATPEQNALLQTITGQSFHYDVTQIDIEFDMLAGFDSIFFNVVFGSEEYPDFIGSSFNDGFGLIINGTNIAFVDGMPVNIDHPSMVAAEGTELNGVLGGGNFSEFVHTFSSLVNPTGNRLTFIIADTGDFGYDSVAYISRLGGTNPVIPEPASLAMTGLGALGVVGLVLRRRKR